MKYETGEFGPIYPQFKGKAKEAIKWLRKQKQGECPNALYREDIGYVDLVWGEPESLPKKGYGLAHIEAEHGNELKQLGFEIEDFIPITFTIGNVEHGRKGDKITIYSDTFKIIITTEWKGVHKKLLLTAFDMRSMRNKNKKRFEQKKSRH